MCRQYGTQLQMTTVLPGVLYIYHMYSTCRKYLVLLYVSCVVFNPPGALGRSFAPAVTARSILCLMSGGVGADTGRSYYALLRMYGTFLRRSWNLLGTFLRPSWNLLTTNLEPSWDLLGTFLRPSWDLLGTFLGNFLGPSWNLLGTFLEPSWNFICKEFRRNS